MSGIFWDLKKVVINGCKCLRGGFPLRLAFTSDISNFSSLPRSTKFPHPYGISIGEKVIIGENVTIMQNVAIGNRYPQPYCSIEGNDGSPRVGNNVFIGASAIILGNVSVADNSIIGAETVVTHNIPKNIVVKGVW